MISTTEYITKEQATEIYNKYSEFVYRIALFIIKSKPLAEDIMQDTFIQVFKKYHQYDLNKPIEPWIYRITVNTARNLLRKQKWLGFFRNIPEQECNEPVDVAFLLEQEKQQLWQAINGLSHKSREVIVLHFYLGMKLNEVAGILNIPVGTCKSRLNSALNVLRKHYSKERSSELIGGEYNEAI